jgi:hypothetical protein
VSVVETIETLCHENKVNEAVDLCFETIEQAFASDDLLTIDRLLHDLDPVGVHYRVAVGALRASSRGRHHFATSWSTLLTLTGKELKSQKLDSNRILRGLSLEGLH